MSVSEWKFPNAFLFRGKQNVLVSCMKCSKIKKKNLFAPKPKGEEKIAKIQQNTYLNSNSAVSSSSSSSQNPQLTSTTTATVSSSTSAASSCLSDTNNNILSKRRVMLPAGTRNPSSSSNHHHQHQSSVAGNRTLFVGLVLFIVSIGFLTFFQTSSIPNISQHDPQHSHDATKGNLPPLLVSSVSEKNNEKNIVKFASSGSRILQNCKSGMLQYNRHFLHGKQKQMLSNIHQLKNNKNYSSNKRVTLSSSWFSPHQGVLVVPALKSVQDLAKALVSTDSTAKVFIGSLFDTTNFHNLFSIQYEGAKLVLPNSLKKQADSMFSEYKKNNPGHQNNNENKNVDDSYPNVDHIESQHIVLSTNRITSETALFNELRKYRPGAMRVITPEEDALIDAKYLEKEGADKCDFCARNKTAEDVFGRIVGTHCYTAANIAKLCDWHGLIINNRHHPIKFSREEVADWLHVARQWFAKAHEQDPQARFPHLMFDAGSRASASQPHLHLQTMLTKTGYFTQAKNLLDRAFDYSYCQSGGDRDYWRDWIKAHEAVGLALHFEGSWLVVSLTPIHDKEIFVIGNSDSESFARLLHFAMRHVYVESSLQVRSFSMGMFFESMGEDGGGGGNGGGEDEEGGEGAERKSYYSSGMAMPAVARMVDRGAPFDVRSDVGAMEFYGAFNVGSDPFFIMERVKTAAKEQGLLRE